MAVFLRLQDDVRTDGATLEPASQEQSAAAAAGAGNMGVSLDEVVEVA